MVRPSWRLYPSAFSSLALGCVFASNCALASDTSTAQAVGDTQPAHDVRLVAHLGHAAGVTSVAFSADSRFVVTGGDDGTGVLWEVSTGAEVRRFATNSKSVRCVAFSPNGRFVLTGGADSHAILWDVKTGDEVRRFQFDSGVTALAYSPDGRWLLAGTEAGTAWLRDASDGSLVLSLGGRSKRINAVAFAPNGRSVLIGSDDKTARLWDLKRNRELRRFEGHKGGVTSVAFSPDGRYALSGSVDLSARLWVVSSGNELRRFDKHPGPVTSVAFSPDGRMALTGTSEEWEVEGVRTIYRGTNGIAVVWDTSTGKEIRRLGGGESEGVHSQHGEVTSVAFSPDGRMILTGSADQTATLWEAAGGGEIRRLEATTNPVASATFSLDGRFILTRTMDEAAQVWDTARGGVLSQFRRQPPDNVVSAAISADGRYVLTGALDETALLWDAKSGKEVRRFFGKAHSLGVNAVALSEDGRLMVTASHVAVRVWDVSNAAQLRNFVGHDGNINSASFSKSGLLLATGGNDGTARVWDVATGIERKRFRHQGAVRSVAFSPDERQLLTASTDRTARLWDVDTGEEVRRFSEQSAVVNATAFSPDGKIAVMGDSAGHVVLRDVSTGAEIRRLEGHLGPVSAVAFSPDGRFVLTGSADHTSRIWIVETGRQLCALVVFRDGGWAVVDNDGHFDASNLEEIRGLHWSAADDPLHALPLEIFMRDYYEPRLLTRLLAGEKLAAIRSLAEVNRQQPDVRIMGVELELPRDAEPANGTVTVTVEVSGRGPRSGSEEQVATRGTGVYDLRLFRDGQLVGQRPDALALPMDAGTSWDEELVAWRQEREVVGAESGATRIKLRGIRLPRRATLKEVEFSAYAFNVDRVKSAAARRRFAVPQTLSPRAGRAYVVTIGVNAFEDPAWNLSYAANDARALGEALKGRLESMLDFATNARQYTEVVWVPLISEYLPDGGQRQLAVNNATKDKIRAVLEQLAGKRVDPARLAGIPGADRLARAEPEDLVVIGLSTHGAVDARGRFYFLPHDIGPEARSQLDPAFLKRAVSNDELSMWLYGLDASELVMIVDACHSAASVQSKEFKPGPMGSRGLGQLAYDKGMRILAASQTDQSALETPTTQLGLLTFALVRDGLEAGRADYSPKDNQILLSEWLSYATERVPELYREWREGKLKGGPNRGQVVSGVEESPGKSSSLQQPALFDFARSHDAVVGSTRP